MLRVIAAVIVAWITAGCALTEDKVPVDYVSGSSTPAPLAGAASVTLSLTASDKRQQYADRIGTKKNGYGMEMAKIVAANDVPTLVRSAVEREFKAQGFSIGSDGLAVTIELQNFYNNFKVGIFSSTAEAEVAFGVRVRNAAGASLYTQFYSATGTVDNVMLATGENAKAALEKALTSAVKQMADDKALQAALLSAAPKDSRTGRSS
jgi:uncharacterized lipoprotein YajG